MNQREQELFASAVARAAVDKARIETPGMKMLPATVVNFTQGEGVGRSLATVHVTGDPADRTLSMPVLTDGTLTAGDVVIVVFDHSAEGAFVLSSLMPPTPAPSDRFAATASLQGVTTLAGTAGDTRVYPPPASTWKQSPGMDDFITVEWYDPAGSAPAGNIYRTLQACDLLVVMQARFALQSESSGDGESGEMLAGFQIESTGAATFDTEVADGDTYQDFLTGAWRRTAFGTSFQNPVGVDCSRVIRFNGPDVIIQPDLYQAMGYSVTFDWKLSLVLLEASTDRDLPVGSA